MAKASAHFREANISRQTLDQFVEVIEEIGDFQAGYTMPRTPRFNELSGPYNGERCPKCGQHLVNPCKRPTCPKR